MLLALAGGHLELDRDAGPLSQSLHHLDEIKVLELAQKREHVAALVAAEAVENLLRDGDTLKLGVFSL